MRLDLGPAAGLPPSSRRDCHFADVPSLCLLKHLLKGEGGWLPQNGSLADGYRHRLQAALGRRPLGGGAQRRLVQSVSRAGHAAVRSWALSESGNLGAGSAGLEPFSAVCFSGVRGMEQHSAAGDGTAERREAAARRTHTSARIPVSLHRPAATASRIAPGRLGGVGLRCR